MIKAVVATKNKHKVIEMQELLSRYFDIKLQTAEEAGFFEEIEETGKTFAENAYIKASITAKKLNIPAIADDSGLCVDAINGEPGIYSARYASKNGYNSNDDENIEKLLENLKDIPENERTARFVSALCFCFPNGQSIDSIGTCEGIITREKRGSGGFGYDPVFYFPTFGKTFGEITENEKNSVSHRANAMNNLANALKNVNFERNN